MFANIGPLRACNSQKKFYKGQETNFRSFYVLYFYCSQTVLYHIAVIIGIIFVTKGDFIFFDVAYNIDFIFFNLTVIPLRTETG